MNVCGVTFGGYLTKILSFESNLLNNSKFHLLSEGTVQPSPVLKFTHQRRAVSSSNILETRITEVS